MNKYKKIKNPFRCETHWNGFFCCYKWLCYIAEYP